MIVLSSSEKEKVALRKSKVVVAAIIKTKMSLGVCVGKIRVVQRGGGGLKVKTNVVSLYPGKYGEFLFKVVGISFSFHFNLVFQRYLHEKFAPTKSLSR